MSSQAYSAVEDRDVVKMLALHPELLAIADAVACVATDAAGARTRTPSRRWRRGLALVGALAAVMLLVTWLSVAPFQPPESISGRALAAIGTQPVLHVVLTDSRPDRSLVELSTGTPVSRVQKVEIWFDPDRDLKMTVTSLDGQVIDELLETRTGGYSRTGPVYTCAWIAAHPTEATRLGVSCSPTGENPSDPRVVPERTPSVDPALANFVDQYQRALAAGEARDVGTGHIGDRAVRWLEFDTEGFSERVAVDATTFEPVAIEQPRGGTRLLIHTAETVPFDSRHFRKPEHVSGQVGGAIVSEQEVSLERGEEALNGRLLWLGAEWGAFRLTEVTLQERVVARGDTGSKRTVSVVKLMYTPAAGRGAPLVLYEATECVVRIGWTCTPRDPLRSDVVGLPLGEHGRIALIRSGDLYVSVWAGDEPRLVEVARALNSYKRGRR